MFGEFTLLRKEVWRMNRSAKGLLILWMVLVWQITDDLPNFLPAKLPRYTVFCQIIAVLQNCESLQSLRDAVASLLSCI